MSKLWFFVRLIQDEPKENGYISDSRLETCVHVIAATSNHKVVRMSQPRQNYDFLSAFIQWESLHYFEWKRWIFYYNIHKSKIMSQLIFSCLQKLRRKVLINQRSSDKIDNSTWDWKIILFIKYKYSVVHIFVKIVMIFCYKVWAFFKK